MLIVTSSLGTLTEQMITKDYDYYYYVVFAILYSLYQIMRLFWNIAT